MFNFLNIQKWSDCQKRLATIGKHGLFARVRKFDVTSITEEKASQVLNLIGRCQREKAAFVSPGVETFYCWVSEAILEMGIIIHSKYFPNSDWLKAHA